MLKVLLAAKADKSDMLGEIPRMLKRAGCHVTLLCHGDQRPFVGSAIDEWVWAPRDEKSIVDWVIAKTTAEPSAYDWIILSQDGLLNSLRHADIPTALKLKIGPVHNEKWLSVLGSKCGSAQFWAENGIRHADFRICRNGDEARAAADAIGFPVVLKLENMSGGSGIFKCNSRKDIERHHNIFNGRPAIVERFIQGEGVCVDPFYHNGKLIAFTCSKALRTHGRFGVCMRREFFPSNDVAPLLEKIGKTLDYNGFINLNFIRDGASGELIIHEMDCRPHIWFGYGHFAGVDFGKAIRKCLVDPSYGWVQAVSRAKSRIVSVFHRELDYYIMLRFKKGFLYWLTNTNNCWQYIPFHDPKLLLRRLRRLYDHALSVTIDDLIAWLQKAGREHRKRRP